MKYIGTRIVLTNQEQDIARLIAYCRNNNNIKKATQNGKFDDKQSDIEINIDGFAAEMAFCKLFHFYPDFSISVRSAKNGTDNGDVVLPNGKSVDIKTTKHKDGNIIIPLWKLGNADIYSLMISEFPAYTYRGSIYSKDVWRKRDLGFGERYLVEQNELKEIEEL